MKTLKWLAALPDVCGLTATTKGTLVVAFDRWGQSVEAIVDMPHGELTDMVALALMCDDDDAAVIARTAQVLLKDLIATADSPPSKEELREFITTRQLQLQSRANLLWLYELLTSDDPTHTSFTPDPRTSETFNPVWLQLAIEMICKLPAK
jgi:hypothetical protein